jgi:hypothetical protein
VAARTTRIRVGHGVVLMPFNYNHPVRWPSAQPCSTPSPAAASTSGPAAGPRFVERLADIGVDEVMCMIQMGTVPQEVCMETIRQWGEKIIPRFRS